MTRNDLAVALHHDRAEVEAAVKNLEDPGFDLQNLSMIDRRSGRRCDRWGACVRRVLQLWIPEISRSSIRNRDQSWQVYRDSSVDGGGGQQRS